MSEQQANNSTNTSQAADDKKEGAEHINLKVVGNVSGEILVQQRRMKRVGENRERYYAMHYGRSEIHARPRRTWRKGLFLRVV